MRLLTKWDQHAGGGGGCRGSEEKGESGRCKGCKVCKACKACKAHKACKAAQDQGQSVERAGRKIQDGGDRADARRGSKKHEREAL